MRVRSATLVAVLLAALAVLAGVPAAAAPGERGPGPGSEEVAWPDDAVPGSLLVTVASPVDVQHVLEVARGRRLTGRVVHVEVPAGDEASAARALRAYPWVRAVEPDLILHRAAEPNDPLFDQQWAHAQTHAPGGWDVTTGDASVRVAVLDDGVNGAHPDLKANIREPQVNVADTTVRAAGTGVDNDTCGYGHGTQVAGVVGAVGNNGSVVSGVNWAVSLVDVALTHPDVEPYCDGYALSAVVAGIDYATSGTSEPVDVINLSFGAPSSACPRALHDAIDQARAAGVVVVASSGNSAGDRTQTFIPASCHGVLSVGATRITGDVAGYSVGNAYVDLVAPGGDAVDGDAGEILTTEYVREDGDPSTPEWATYAQGTSYSAPYVAGLAGLLRATRSALTPDQIESLLERNASDISPAGFDDTSGWGLIDVGATLAAAGGTIAAPYDEPSFPVSEGDGTLPPPSGPPEVHRVSNGSDVTDPIGQAVAASDATFPDDGAAHAVISRDDVFADALAGSALGFGYGPILFTGSSGPLSQRTERELVRVLPDGATVYLLGGPAALPTALEGEIRGLGFRPARLWGEQREETAVAVAEEVIRLDFPRLSTVLLATRGNWPDAVTGGSIASWFGTPVLLTPPDFLDEATADLLRRLRGDVTELYVLGGHHVISEPVMAEAAAALGAPAVRLAGAARDGTAVAIAERMEHLLWEWHGALPGFVSAVNVDRSDGWAHVLSATAITGSTAGVFVPVREGGPEPALTDLGRDYVRGLGIDGLLIGGPALVPDAVGDELETLLGQ